MTAIGPIPSDTQPNILVAWGPRAEDAQSIADRLAATLADLDALTGRVTDDAAAQWLTFPEGQEVPDGEALVDFVRATVPKDDGGNPTPALGFHINVAKGATAQRAGISISLFVGASVGTPDSANRVQLSVRSNSSTQLESEFRSRAHDILKVLIEAWDPDRGTAGTVAQTVATTRGRSGPPKVAAVTWLSARFEVPEHVPGAVVTRTPIGSILTLGSLDEADTSADAATAVQQFLIDQKVFTPRQAVG
jgi:hypothetical protein